MVFVSEKGDCILAQIISIDKDKNKDEIQVNTEKLLADIKNNEIPKNRVISVPISELAILGAGVSSLIPALNTVTHTSVINTADLYRLANKSTGDTLKVAKNGNFWGAFKKADGKSKFLQLQSAGPISETNTITMNVNPAMLMMSVALYSIEKELGNIADMEKQIISFLQVEKESEIESDVVTLNEIIQKYKHNWDNEHYIASNHKMVLDIKRTARKNMISFQKSAAEAIKAKKLVVVEGQINNSLSDMLKKFKYYRLSVYTFSLASMVEIMLSGNFKEENIKSAIDEVDKISDEYRSLFSECSLFLEKMANVSIEKNMLNGVGHVSNAVGKIIGNIPKIKEGQVDEFLQEAGAKIQSDASDISKDVIEMFAEVSNPNTGIFVRKLEEMIQIYDKTSEICFDDKNIYLIA